MTWFEDLSECGYFPIRVPALRAVAWLGRGRPFPVGAVEARVYSTLLELSKTPWQPMGAAGWHDCDLCVYEPGAKSIRNLFIPGRGVIYVCPEMVTHYMNVHGYKPPQEFCDAVLACPPMRSMEYLRAILANGGRDLVKTERGLTTG
jgi:hypothetical protein